MHLLPPWLRIEDYKKILKRTKNVLFIKLDRYFDEGKWYNKLKYLKTLCIMPTWVNRKVVLRKEE